jgi:molybdopterin converting factor small subunit
VTVAFVLPGPLRPLAAGLGNVAVGGRPQTVAEALEGLCAAHPELRLRILDEQGRVRPHVNVFVDHINIRETGGLGTPLGETAEIAILPAVSGGR